MLKSHKQSFPEGGYSPNSLDQCVLLLASFFWQTEVSQLPCLSGLSQFTTSLLTSRTLLSGSAVLMLWQFPCLHTVLHHSYSGDAAAAALSREKRVLKQIGLWRDPIAFSSLHHMFLYHEFLKPSPPGTSRFIPGKSSWLQGTVRSLSLLVGVSHCPQGPLPVLTDRTGSQLAQDKSPRWATSWTGSWAWGAMNTAITRLNYLTGAEGWHPVTHRVSTGQAYSEQWDIALPPNV